MSQNDTNTRANVFYKVQIYSVVKSKFFSSEFQKKNRIFCLSVQSTSTLMVNRVVKVFYAGMSLCLSFWSFREHCRSYSRQQQQQLQAAFSGKLWPRAGLRGLWAQSGPAVDCCLRAGTSCTLLQEVQREEGSKGRQLLIWHKNIVYLIMYWFWLQYNAVRTMLILPLIVLHYH